MQQIFGMEKFALEFNNLLMLICYIFYSLNSLYC